jgi:hypothetical protein
MTTLQLSSNNSIYLFVKYLLSPYLILDTLLGTKDVVKLHALMILRFKWGGTQIMLV